MAKAKKLKEVIVELDPDKLERLEEIEELRKEKPAIEIVSATLRGGLFCSYVYNHNLGNEITNEAKIKSDLPVHADMKKAFAKLNAHLAVVCEEVEPSSIDDIDTIADDEDETIDRFTVQSVDIVGDMGNDGVVLSGYKRLKSGDTLQLKAPKIKFGSSYPFIGDLTIHVYDLIDEVGQYMKGKRAPEVQQDLFETEESFAEEAL